MKTQVPDEASGEVERKEGEERIEFQKIFVILNPIAGHSDAEGFQKAFEELAEEKGWDHEIYLTTGEENVSEVAEQACRQGADLVIAGGGDGTVAGVINGLVETRVPLGIVPVGTGNGLARAMNIPLAPEEAMRVLTGEHRIIELDAMEVGGKYFVLNVSAGISSRAMRATDPEKKKRFGILAYVQTILKDALEGKTHTFRLTVDGNVVMVKATEVLVSNGEVLKGSPLLFGQREQFNDGQLNLNILTASKPGDYIRLASELILDSEKPKSELHDLIARETITLDVVGRPQPVQADGEVIGKTPVQIRLVHKAIRVLVPA